MNVGIFSVGLGRVNTGRLCALLNSPPSPFDFQQASAICNLGEPDLSGYAYSDSVLSTVIRPHADPFDVTVIITGVPIQDNYFTRTVGTNLLVATFHQTEELLQASGRTPEEYAAVAICTELVSFEFQRVTGLTWRELFHEDPRACIFDFAGIKSQKAAKLAACTICDDCLGKLARCNADTQVVGFAKSLLARIRTPSFSRALKLSVAAPLLGFVYGGLVVGTVVNLFTSVVMNDNPLTPFQLYFTVAFASSILVYPLCVYAWLRLREIRRRLHKGSPIET